MESNPTGAAMAPDPHLVPPILATWLSVFRPCFTAPVWARVLVLVAGAVLAPGRRTVTQALRVMGLADEAGFRRYHEVLSRARWDARAIARRLLLHIIERLSSGAGARGSRRAASIATLSAPPRGTSSRPAACAGSR
jgi:hypothetical protein